MGPKSSLDTMLLMQVRISGLGRHGFSCRRELAPLFVDSTVADDAAAVSGEIAGISSLFPPQDLLECTSRTSFSTYSRFAKQAGNSGWGSVSDEVLLMVSKQAFFVSFQRCLCTP